ncbi:MAG: yfiV [Chloroflexi bacterium]|jgi:DNA-binding MarR family transcriptional regulator|nr:yfiV [Chloroflexota bacterium]
MDEKRQKINQHVVEYQKIFMQAMQGGPMPEFLGSDMTMPQFKILFLLQSRGRLRMSEIAHALGKNISTATGIVDRLVEQNIIQREEDPEDRRAVLTRLTSHGQELYETFSRSRQQNIQRILDRLTTEELAVIEQAMRLMARVAVEDMQERLGDKTARP